VPVCFLVVIVTEAAVVTLTTKNSILMNIFPLKLGVTIISCDTTFVLIVGPM